MADQDDWFRAFVERSLQEVWDSREIVKDDDGDYPFGEEGAIAYVSVDPAPLPGVCVWSYAAHGVKGSAGVLREVNDLNIQSRLCKVMWRSGVIRVELRLPADQVSAESLARACGNVHGMSADIGQMFAVVHGGASALVQPRAG